MALGRGSQRVEAVVVRANKIDTELSIDFMSLSSPRNYSMFNRRPEDKLNSRDSRARRQVDGRQMSH